MKFVVKLLENKNSKKIDIVYLSIKKLKCADQWNIAYVA
jgi:hypothetical protein